MESDKKWLNSDGRLCVHTTSYDGQPIQRYNYSSYGKTSIEKLNQSANARIIKSPYAYTSRELDSSNGDYFYRNRYYDPRTQKFLSEDPIGFSGSDANLYRYLGNNPIRQNDPFGLEACIGVSYGYHTFITIDDPKDPNFMFQFDLLPAGGTGFGSLYSSVPGRIYRKRLPKSKGIICDGGDKKSDQEKLKKLDYMRQQFIRSQLLYDLTGVSPGTMNCWGMVLEVME